MSAVSYRLDALVTLVGPEHAAAMTRDLTPAELARLDGFFAAHPFLGVDLPVANLALMALDSSGRVVDEGAFAALLASTKGGTR